MPPKLNRERARFVLAKIDKILSWEQLKDRERDTKFVELGRYLCEVRAEQYWRVESLKSFDDFLEKRFPGSRRKAYYLMSIHENLPPEARKQLKEVGWTKGLELAKLARKNKQPFDCAIWLHRAREMPTDQFKAEIANALTGQETEPRYTKNLDVLVHNSPENSIRVVRALRKSGAPLDHDGVTPETFTERQVVYQIGIAPVRLDLMTEITGVDFAKAWKDRVPSTLFGVPAHFISQQDLNTNKRALGRATDLEDLKSTPRKKSKK